jgi:predicted nucleic acid-binding protein
LKKILVDSNILLDILTEDSSWSEWSTMQLKTLAEHHILAINPIVYSEISARFTKIEDLENCIRAAGLTRMTLPWEAAFLAGKVFIQYKKNGGTRQSSLPDFFIGAHAAVEDMLLLTRDVNRYRTYFPKLELIHLI